MSLSTTTTDFAKSASGLHSSFKPVWVASQILPGIHPVHGRGYVAIAPITLGARLFVISENVPSATSWSPAVESQSTGGVSGPESAKASVFNARFSDATTVVATRPIKTGELIQIQVAPESKAVASYSEGNRSTITTGANVVLGFLKSALQNEWGAAVVSFTSAIPSNVLSCLIVVWGAEWLKINRVFESEAAYISAVSLLTGFVGYATYLLGYYGGMILKERADLFEEGVFSWTKFRRKWRVIWYDFVIHLPSDFYSLPLLSAGQGGMYVAGVSQFWSIFWAQAIADAISAVKEPFFWHGAKKLVDFTERRAANTDRVDDNEDRAAND